SILDKEKLNGSNFLDWYRNLRIVLRNEQKLHHLEEALPEAPPTTATAVVCNAYTCRVAEQQEVACLMLVSMTPEIQQNLEDRPAFEILQELKTMFQQRLLLDGDDGCWSVVVRWCDCDDGGSGDDDVVVIYDVNGDVEVVMAADDDDGGDGGDGWWPTMTRAGATLDMRGDGRKARVL
nr:zinc finger, CCHC-type [Tanacetum cinerariifolium]